MMLLHLHACTSPADKRVYQEHLKVTTNRALRIIILWKHSLAKINAVLPFEVEDRHLKYCCFKVCSLRRWSQFFYCYAPFFTVNQYFKLTTEETDCLKL